MVVVNKKLPFASHGPHTEVDSTYFDYKMRKFGCTFISLRLLKIYKTNKFLPFLSLNNNNGNNICSNCYSN